MKYEEFDYDAHFNEAYVEYEHREALQVKIKKQFQIIEHLVARFNEQLRGESHVELIFVRGADISPLSSSSFGHVIRFPAQLVIEYYEFMARYLGVPSIDPTHQRCRRVSAALMYAFSHEFSHNMKAHTLVLSGEGLTEDQVTLASETDADFSAGMMSYLSFYNSAQGDKLFDFLNLNNNAAPLWVFTKDSGYAAVMLAFFLHCKTKGEAVNYHAANIRYHLLLAGFLYAISETEPGLERFLFSGVEEAIQRLKGLEVEEHRRQVESFFSDNSKEFDAVMTSTAENVDRLRDVWESSSDIIAISKKYMDKSI